VTLKRTVHLGLFCLLSFGVSWACITATKQSGLISTLWPLDPLALAVVVRWANNRREQVLALAGYGLALTLGNALTGSPLLLAAAFPLANIAGICLSAWMLRRVGSDLTSPKAFMLFLLGPVLLSPLLSGALAAGAAVLLASPDKPLAMLVNWTFAVSVGTATVGPFVLSLRPSIGGPRRTPRQIAVFTLAMGVVATASAIIFLDPQWPPLFMIYPALILGALADDEYGGVLAVLIAAVFVVYGTITGVGPAAVADVAGVDRVVFAQLTLMVMAASVLPITALLRKLNLYARELEQRRSEAEAMSQARSKLLAYVSHEIRSPLAGVTTLAQMLRDGQFGELTPAQRETLTQIASSGAEVDALASDLIDTAALQLGKASVSLGQVEIAPVVSSVVEAVQMRMADYAAVIQVENDTDSDSVAVIADPLRLRQILVNLVVNGVKYGGRPPVVRLRIVERAGTVRFEVSDNGKGVPKAKRGDLFGDFQRLGAEKSDIAGSGLGLSLSREIARLQGGELGIGESDLGGLCIWLQLPVWRPAVVAWEAPTFAAAIS